MKDHLDRGWTLDQTPPPPGIDPRSYVYAGFDRAGFRVSFSASRSRTTDGWVDVYISNLGNVDARSLPQMADAKPVISNWNYASYKTDAKPADVVAFYRKDLGAAGWREYGVSLAAFHLKEDRHLIGFAQNGVEIFLNIKGDLADPTPVERSVSLRDRPAVTPTDKSPKAATFDEGRRSSISTASLRLGRIPCSTTARPRPPNDHPEEKSRSARFSVTGLEAFYRDKLKSAGWSETDASTDLDDEARLVFTKDATSFPASSASEANDKTVVQVENLGNVRAADIPRLADASERTRGAGQRRQLRDPNARRQGDRVLPHAVREARLEGDRGPRRPRRQPAPRLPPERDRDEARPEPDPGFGCDPN